MIQLNYFFSYCSISVLTRSITISSSTILNSKQLIETLKIVDDKLTELEVVETFLDSGTLFSLVADFPSEEITSRDELPLEVLGEGHGVFLFRAAWWSHEENAAD